MIQGVGLDILDDDGEVVKAFGLSLCKVGSGKVVHSRDTPTKTTCGLKGPNNPVSELQGIKFCGRCLEVCNMNARMGALWLPKYGGTLPPDFPLHYRIIDLSTKKVIIEGKA